MEKIELPTSIGEIVADLPVGSAIAILMEDGKPWDFIQRTGETGWLSTRTASGSKYLQRDQVVSVINDYVERPVVSGPMTFHVLYHPKRGWL